MKGGRLPCARNTLEYWSMSKQLQDFIQTFQHAEFSSVDIEGADSLLQALKVKGDNLVKVILLFH